ncbi:MAG: divalent-cation tolerance protein CutA [Pyrinomonadaceae bacterium]
MIVVFTTAPTELEAGNLAKKIVGAKLAACVQILPKIESYYFWEDEIKKEPEHLMLIKTIEGKFDELEKFIVENHSYEIPEVVAVKAERISSDYLDWVNDYLR